MELKKSTDYKGIPIPEVMKDLYTSGLGLSGAEAGKRLRRFGPNDVPEKKRSPVLDLLFRYWGPMPWLLELTIVLSLFLRHVTEAVFIFVLLSINAAIGFWNEHKSQKALDLLKEKLSLESRVLRDGRWLTLNAKEIVPGDVIGIGLGDIIPADLKIISGTELSVDQAALTGESLPVTVHVSDLAYSGSIVKRGQAQGVVLNTGVHTRFGMTIELVKTAHFASHQQEIMMAVVRYMMYAGVAAIILVGIDALLTGTDIITLLTIALIFLMGAVPVALPAVFSVVLAVGAVELAKKSVLVTKLSSIEDAASMTVLCLDKTGTITQNRMTVMDPVPFDGFTKADVSWLAAMASGEAGKDQIDEAVLGHAEHIGGKPPYRKISFTPFRPDLKRSEAVVESGGEKFRVVKGDLNVEISLCRGITDEEKNQVEEAARRLSEKGYRVLAVARSSGGDLDNLVPAGLLPLADPPRPDSREMIENMKKLGIRIIMLTGDNIAIAREVASEVSIGERIITISELKNLDESKQADLLLEADGLAGIYPEDKFRIVKLLQERGYIVGMTGDGVNDAPALKQAEVGIAVSNATDVAKASASIVLTEPGVSAIKSAVETSRQIFQRMLSWVINKVTKVIQFIGLLTIGFLLLHELLLSPLDMVLLVFANDFITMSLATDNVTATTNPNAWNVRDITMASLVLGAFLIAEGLIALAIGLKVFTIPPAGLQSYILLLLVFTSQFKIFIVRERRHFWSSPPATALLVSSVCALVVFFLLGASGFLMKPIALPEVAFTLIFSGLFTLILDIPKTHIFQRFNL